MVQHIRLVLLFTVFAKVPQSGPGNS